MVAPAADGAGDDSGASDELLPCALARKSPAGEAGLSSAGLRPRGDRDGPADRCSNIPPTAFGPRLAMGFCRVSWPVALLVAARGIPSDRPENQRQQDAGNGHALQPRSRLTYRPRYQGDRAHVAGTPSERNGTHDYTGTTHGTETVRSEIARQIGESARILLGGRKRNRTAVRGFAVLCIATLPSGQPARRPPARRRACHIGCAARQGQGDAVAFGSVAGDCFRSRRSI